MITIANQKTALPGTPDYRELMMLVTDTIPAGGLSVGEIKSRIRVQDAVEKSGEQEIRLEDADHETLKSCVDAMRWGVVHRDIIAFEDAVKNAPATK